MAIDNKVLKIIFSSVIIIFQKRENYGFYQNDST